MSECTIRKLKRKFILVTVLSLTAAMLVTNALLYLGSMAINEQIVSNRLQYLVEHKGFLEDDGESWVKDAPAYVQALEDVFVIGADYESPEFRYLTRYFVVLFDADRSITEVRTSHISAVSDEKAEEYGRMALEENKETGRFGDYYYQIDQEEDGSGMVIYVDGANMLRSNMRLLRLALILIGFGIILAIGIACLFADKAIQSEVKNAEIQKRFMTDISHELKTPLAVIRANTEMLEVLEGENEWTASSLRQVDRMNGLIKSLVMISRAEEKTDQSLISSVDMSEAVRESVQNFKAMAISEEKAMVEEVDDGIRVLAEEARIRQVCAILLDNAIKYCDDGGEIRVSLKSKGRNAIFQVSNHYEEGANVDYTRFFDRFYRQDESHNIDRGGYGIGLSIAESIVENYHGSIDVSWKDGIITFTCQFRLKNL